MGVSTRYEWVADAACRGLTDVFFGPEKETTAQRIARQREAKAVCRSCPVRQECLDAAIVNYEKGIWGGMSDHERKVYRRQRRQEIKEKVIAHQAGPVERATPSWQIVDTRQNTVGDQVTLRMSETGTAWHGFEFAVFRGETLLFLANNEPDAWLYFQTALVT